MRKESLISRYKQPSSTDIKSGGKQKEELGNKRTRLTPLINLGFITRKMIHHYVLHAVMQKDILGTTSEALLPKKTHKI